VDGVTADRTIHVTLKLYATLGKYLPATAQRANAVALEVPASSTMADLVGRFAVPEAACFLVLVNGVFLPPGARGTARFAEGDTIAIWPPVAGG
jgi:sulfur carrier protein ThiS